MTSPERDVLELIEGDRFDEECDVGFAGFDEAYGFGCLADVTNVAEVRDGFLIEAEELVEDYGVELGDAELTLFGGEALHERGDGCGLGSEDVVAVAGGCYGRNHPGSGRGC